MSNQPHLEVQNPAGLPENTQCRHEIVNAANGVQLSSGVIQTRGRCEWRSLSPAGLSLGIARGQMSFDLDGRWRSELHGYCGFLLSTGEPIETLHVVHQESRIQAVSLHLSEATLDAMQLRRDDFDFLNSARGRASPSFRSWLPHMKTTVLAQQIIDCPHRGSLRTLYLEGKSLELLATVLGSLDEDAKINRGRPPLSAKDIERLTEARDILMGAIDSPPSLDELARRVGMSTSRLTAGFRKQFATSVTEFVQERRLEQALSDLTEGRATVSQAAFKVGYSPAYFSTLFRRRFGFPPSLVAARKH